MDLTRKFLVRLAHAVADYHEAKAGAQARVFLNYLGGLKDAVWFLEGPADVTIAMHQALHLIGRRPSGSAMNRERKAWEDLMVTEWCKQSNVKEPVG